MLTTLALLALGRPALGLPIHQPPAGVVQVVDALDWFNSIVQLKDGTLLAARSDGRGQTSTDGGRTWSDPEPLGPPDLRGTSTLLRLRSGALALGCRTGVTISTDETKSWGPVHPVKLLGIPNQAHPDVNPDNTCAYGILQGKRVRIECHYHRPEIDIASVSYSDDLGETWQMCDPLMGWFDANGIPNGFRGVTAVDEPTVAETADGRVLLFARSTVGRIVYTYSSDQGETWTAVRPTKLAASYSPPRLVRIPQTGDLLCVWNQVSRGEIQRGYWRSRLSAAISTDSGETWSHFKTIEISTGLKDIAVIPPEYPITPVRARRDVGQLPDDYGTYDYPNVEFIGDKVFVTYICGSPAEGAARILRIYPLEWFYE